jgi:hypothetical protein
MKRNMLFFALAGALGLAVAGPTFAATKTKPSEVKALQALIEKQQQQLDQQQQDLQALRTSLQQLEGQQVQQQAQIQQVQAAPPAKVAPPTFASAPGVSVSLNGFVSATAFSQSKSFTFGNGQNAEFPVAGSKGRLSGVDVRNTRFWLDFKGSKVAGDWLGSGHIEMDFFGGFNGTGAFSQQQPNPRLRTAYMDLSNPQTGSVVRIGQQWELMFPLDNLPASLSHVAFPLGLGGGLVGWRFPGAVWMQDLNHGSAGPQWRLDLGGFEGNYSGPGDNVNYLTAGNAGFRPQLEARLHVEDKNWLAYGVVHYSQIDLRGVGGMAPTPIESSFTSEGYEIGGNWRPGAWIFKANVYTGRGLGEIFGDLTQFGDIKETGGYLTAGYHFTPNWSANLSYVYSKLNRNDVVRWLGTGPLGRVKNRQTAFGLQYTAGAYDFGVEWMYDKLDTIDGTGTKTTNGNQLSVSALYHF